VTLTPGRILYILLQSSLQYVATALTSHWAHESYKASMFSQSDHHRSRCAHCFVGDIGSDSKATFTDLKTVLIIHPSGMKQVEVEMVPLKDDDLRTFRIISTAYFLKAMPHPHTSIRLETPRENMCFGCLRVTTTKSHSRTKKYSEQSTVSQIIGRSRRCLPVLSMETICRETRFAQHHMCWRYVGMHD
jgi:hypothetical protein